VDDPVSSDFISGLFIRPRNSKPTLDVADGTNKAARLPLWSGFA